MRSISIDGVRSGSITTNTTNTTGASTTNTTNATGGSVAPTSGNSDIRPFSVNVPEAELTELRRRIVATRWPEKETIADGSQGVQTRLDASARAVLGE